jgi:fructokinase
VRRARIGVDLGGTKIEAIVLERDGTISARERVATPKQYEATLDAVSALVRRLESAAGAAASVGVGIPGSIGAESGVVKNANSVWLNGRPLAADLARLLERPVRVMNDANCFAISEAADGAGRDATIVFGVILGTGVGGGIVVRGRALDGANLIAGEWGHNPLPWMTPAEYPGIECYCGRTGCIETFLCGPRFEETYASRCGVALSAAEIVSTADAGEAAAVATLREYEDRLARALASVINVLDPDAIVLGGGMSNISTLADAVRAKLPRYVFSDSVRTRVVRNVHGDSSGVRGAAWLWPLDAH